MWISDIEIAVFSRIKAKGSPLKKKYPNIFFTAENETDETVAVFPTVYVQEIPGTEQGRSLDGSEITAYLSTFQINIAHNGTKAEIREIMDNCLETMKSMRFEVTGTPIYTKEGGVWNSVARFRRSIGGNDTL